MLLQEYIFYLVFVFTHISGLKRPTDQITAYFTARLHGIMMTLILKTTCKMAYTRRVTTGPFHNSFSQYAIPRGLLRANASDREKE